MMRMIALAVNLARSVGLRGATRVIKLFFEWLGLKCKTPSRTSIRNWLQRLGIAKMNEPLGDHEDLVIMADHSNQIGTEKMLAVLAVKTSALPERVKPCSISTFACWKSNPVVNGKRKTCKANTKRSPIVMERLGWCWSMERRNCEKGRNAWKSGGPTRSCCVTLSPVIQTPCG
ncbi:MAG: hypothetical protein O3C40_20620 [Planctomycetota bacterium]|nr:hypothetical protein [Planctomycetota bacterium]